MSGNIVGETERQKIIRLNRESGHADSCQGTPGYKGVCDCGKDERDFFEPMLQPTIEQIVRQQTHVARAMERARAIAASGIRPSTLVAEFSTANHRVTKDEIVEAIANALLPFVKKMDEPK